MTSPTTARPRLPGSTPAPLPPGTEFATASDVGVTEVSGAAPRRVRLRLRSPRRGRLRAWSEGPEPGAREIERMRLLTEVTRSFAEATADASELIDIVVRRTAEVVGDFCMLTLVSADGRWLEPAAAFDLDPVAHRLLWNLASANRTPLDAPDSVHAQVLAGRSVILPRVDRAQLTERFRAEDLPAATALRIQSVLLVPLRAYGRALGTLSILRHGEGSAPFDKRDMVLVENLAGHAARALANARLLATEQAARAGAERAEAARRGAEDRFRALIEHNADGITLMSATGTVRYRSPAARRILGIPEGEDDAIEEGFGPVHADDRAVVAAALAEVVAAPGGSRTLEFRARHRDGAWRWLEVTTTNLVDDPAVGALVSNLRDVTERHDMLDQLRASEGRYRAILENVPDVIWTRDSAGELHYVSSNVEALSGYSQEEFLRGGAALTLSRVHPDDLGALKAASAALLTAGTPMDLDYRFQRRDGRWVVVRNRASAVRETDGVRYVDGISTDVTEHRGVEAQLRQSQKMDAVGRLAGGVAHDFNNLLSVILGYAEIALQDLRPGEPLRDDFSEIKRAAERGADLTQQLLAFSRQQVLAPRVLDLTEVVAGTENMLRRLVGEDVELSLHAAPGAAWCKVDRGQVEQVVMNLVVNARDAMPAGGQLAIETSAVELDATYAHEHLEAAPGPYVLLSVTDNGAGMDGATQARIFEPFFTTKEKGKGTGLGLATVFGIVKQSGGHLSVDSRLGVGTTFKVYLPRVPAKAEPAPAAAPPTVSRGTETVLLVEDEDALRTLARNVLRRNGYHVLAAANAGEALLHCEQFGARIDLLLTDVVMPQMNGRQLAERLAPMRPEMGVLYMSGYTGDSIVHHGVLDSGISFLPKPLTPAGLLKKVREVLDGRRPAGVA